MNPSSLCSGCASAQVGYRAGAGCCPPLDRHLFHSVGDAKRLSDAGEGDIVVFRAIQQEAVAADPLAVDGELGGLFLGLEEAARGLENHGLRLDDEDCRAPVAQTPHSQAQKSRSNKVNFGFFTERCRTPS